ncbi:MAG: ClpXP protease specificity-enhancing factor [Aquabacterium sp.]
MSTDQEAQGSSTRPYLIRALHDWCTDNGFTPYLAVYVDRSVQVPQEYVKNNEIVLNVSFEATSQLQLGNDFIEFKARFGGVARDISVPVDHVIAIYARENGQGMAFPVPTSLGGDGQDAPASTGEVVDGVHDGLPPARKAEAPDAGQGLRLARPPKAGKGRALEPVAASTDKGDEPPPEPPAGGARPTLRRVK